MKELIYSNFQFTRSTGMLTTFTVDGVQIEMRKRGTSVPAKAKKAKGKKPRRPSANASRTKDKATEQPAKTSKAAAVRRTEAAPQ